MKRVKMTGLAMIVALACTAGFGVSTASASWLVSDSSNTTLHGTPTNDHFWSVPMGTFGCDAPEFADSLEGQASEAFMMSPGDDYSCTAFGNTTLEMNDCEMTFRPGTETSAGKFGGTIDIGPPSCGPMTMTYSVICNLTIAPQDGLSATYENVGAGSTAGVVISVDGTGLTTTDNCSQEGSNGSYSGSWSLTGHGGGGQTGIRVSATVPTGLYVAGEESEDPWSQPRLTAEGYPVTINASASVSNVLETAAGELECGEASGSSNPMSFPQAERSIGIGFEDCSFGSFSKTTVDASGCEILFSVANSDSPYVGGLDLECEGAAAVEIAPTLFGYPICTVSVPAQALGAVSYSNAGEGAERHVIATATGEADLEYAVSGGGGSCGAEGAHEDGEFNSVFELSGTR